MSDPTGVSLKVKVRNEASYNRWGRTDLVRLQYIQNIDWIMIASTPLDHKR